MLDIITIPVTLFEQNARIVACSQHREAIILDPGGEAEKILDRLARSGYRCVGIWLTHAHLDHCGAVEPILQRLAVPLVAHPMERPMRERVRDIAAMYGLPSDEWHNCPEPSEGVMGGEQLRVGDHIAEVIFTPGHSPGHVSYFFRNDGILLSGDVLFQGSIGRTDLPGGDHAQLISTIKEKILCLPDDTKVLSGHGNDTTVGRERRSNPFLCS